MLETTFRTDSGAVRVTDALTLHDRDRLSPLRELARVVDGLEGTVVLEWSFQPRLDYGRRKLRLGRRGDALVAVNGKDALALTSWGAGDGRFTLAAGERATLALTYAQAEPLVLPARDDVERRLEQAAAFWAGLELAARLRRSLAGRRRPQRARAQAPRVLAFGLHRGRADDVAP